MTSIARLVSETATCLGTGILGLSYVLIKGNGIKIMKYLTFSSIGAGVLYSLIQRNRQKQVNDKLILITGCDSGLGYVENESQEFSSHWPDNLLIFIHFRFNMALYCNLKLNMYVVAACLNTNSEGARKLLEQCNSKRFLLVELDIRKSASILHIEKTMINLLASNNNLGKYSLLFGV